MRKRKHLWYLGAPLTMKLAVSRNMIGINGSKNLSSLCYMEEKIEM